MSAYLECSNVSKVYHQGDNQVHALKDVSLSVNKGEFLALCGPSGSGKTTLLNMIGGLDLPTSGSISLDGNIVTEMDPAERAVLRLQKLGFIFQAYNLVPVLSAVENVGFVMTLQGVSKAECDRRAAAILKEVGLGGMEHRRPSQLSGGQQQRVAVARAIVGNPSLVLADEPTANLDSKTAESLLGLMLKLNKERGVTFLFSTHDKLVMSYARRKVNLKDGRVVSDEVRKEDSVSEAL